eukprot:gene22783-59502_t
MPIAPAPGLAPAQVRDRVAQLRLAWPKDVGRQFAQPAGVGTAASAGALVGKLNELCALLTARGDA